MNCILCLSEKSDSNVKEKIKKKSLIDLYKRDVSIDIQEYLKHLDVIDFVVCNNCGIQYFNPPVTAPTEFYEALSRNAWYYTIDKAEFDYCAKIVNAREQSLLEIGAGEGNFAVKLKKRDKYVGLEYNEEGRKKAKAKGIELLNLSIDEFSKSNIEKFDSVAFFQVLEHVENPYAFMKSALSTVRAGGNLYLSVPSSESFYAELTNHTLDLPPHHVSRWSDEALRKIGSIFNLELESIYHEPIQKIHFRSYLFTKIQGMFFLRNDLVRDDFLYKATSLFSRALTKLMYPMFESLMYEKLKNRLAGGHVTAIYKKI